MIKAVIFDMDGVLVDSEGVWTLADKEWIESFGVTFHTKAKQQIIGTGLIESTTKLKRLFGLNGVVRRLLTHRLSFIYAHRKKVKVMPGATQLLKKLSKTDLKLAVASSCSKKLIHAFLTPNNLLKYFISITSGLEVKKGKPAPDIFLLSAKRLTVRPREAIVIEDSPHGVLAAKRAGMLAIAVIDRRFTKFSDFKHADARVYGLSAVYAKIIELSKKEQQ